MTFHSQGREQSFDHPMDARDDELIEVVEEEEAEEEGVNPEDGAPKQQLRRHDSLELQAATIRRHSSKGGGLMDRASVLRLAFQSVGIVYGDIGTSPLYVFSSTFVDGIQHEDDVLGVLSLIFYTITLIPLVKYVFIVLRATDNGNGGTFALYSLICRHAKVGLLPSQQAEDRQVSNYSLELPNRRAQRASMVKAVFERSSFAKHLLLFVTMLGTSMVVGDGILTPCISVLSAVGGIKEATDSMTQDRIVLISAVIIVLIFLAQRFGTDKVGYTFAPIITVWFLSIAAVGLHNWIKYDPGVIKAVNPKYIVDYFRRNGKTAWISLGGIVLCITGVEALFADVGHFTVRSIRISMCSMAFPSLILAYAGQASYLRKNMGDVADTFYKSTPDGFYWPMFVVAISAAIIASQAMISGTFSIIQQSLALGCFPRVKVIHTSSKYEGQVYIPEVNYALMIACIAVTASFRDTITIGNAYGIAVVFVMVLTSALLVLVMITIWKTSVALIALYLSIVGSIELIYLSAVLYKFNQGGYLPLSFSLCLIAVMLLWNYVHRKRYSYELLHKISQEKLEELIANTSAQRMPGVAFFYSELVQGAPPIFEHYVVNVPTLHSVIVFVSIKSLPVGKVLPQERFLFRRSASGDRFVFRCVARYGYKDVRSEEEEPFEVLLIRGLMEFVERDGGEGGAERKGDELELVGREMKKGVVHFLGENEVVAGRPSPMWKRLVIDHAYGILKRNLRQQDEVFTIPRKKLFKVGITIEL